MGLLLARGLLLQLLAVVVDVLATSALVFTNSIECDHLATQTSIHLSTVNYSAKPFAGLVLNRRQGLESNVPELKYSQICFLEFPKADIFRAKHGQPEPRISAKH